MIKKASKAIKSKKFYPALLILIIILVFAIFLLGKCNKKDPYVGKATKVSENNLDALLEAGNNYDYIKADYKAEVMNNLIYGKVYYAQKEKSDNKSDKKQSKKPQENIEKYELNKVILDSAGAKQVLLWQNNTTQNKVYCYTPQYKKGFIIKPQEFQNMGVPRGPNFYNRFLGSGKIISKEKIAGYDCQKIETIYNKQKMTAWLSLEYGFPVKIISENKNNPAKNINITFDNIDLHPIDNTIFKAPTNINWQNKK